MNRRLFEDLIVSAKTRRGRGGLALPASITLHVAVVGVALGLSVFGTAQLVPEVAARPMPVLLAPAIAGVAPRIPPLPRGEATSRRLTSLPPASGGPRVVPIDLQSTSLPGADADPIALGPSDCIGPQCFADPQLGPPGPAGEPGGGDTGGDGPGVSRTVRASVDVAPPIKLRDVLPIYPELAKRAGIQGVVIIECTIDPNGRIAGARVLRGQPLLDAAALDAVQQWLYRPTLLNGSPVSVVMTVTVRFSLARS